MSDFFEEEAPIENEKTLSDRAQWLGEALIDAKDAFEFAGIVPTTEDLRSVAIHFGISKEKHAVTDKISEQRKQQYSRPVATTDKPVNQKLEWYSIQNDIPVTVKILEDKGEFDTKFGKNHGFVVEIDGQQYKLGTTSKVLLPKFIVGNTVTFRKYTENKFTKYEVK